MSAVEQSDPFLGLKDDGFQISCGQSFSSAVEPSINPRLAFADKHQRRMGKRRKIARRTHRPARGDHRRDAVVEQIGDPLDEFESHAGESSAQTRCEDQQHPPHQVIAQRLSYAGRMRAQEIPLHLTLRTRLDAAARQRSEPGVDAVDRFRACCEAFNDRLCRRHRCSRAIADPHRPTAARHRFDVIKRQRLTVQHQRILGHGR